LQKFGFSDSVIQTSATLYLRNQTDVDKFFTEEMPDYLFLAAAKVGGIHANSVYRADFLYENLMIEANVIQQLM